MNDAFDERSPKHFALPNDVRSTDRSDHAFAGGTPWLTPEAAMIRWSTFLVVCAIALGRALSASARALPPPADEAAMHAAAVDMISHERELRVQAAKDFPTDPWSQDDAFHSSESKKAHEYAAAHRLPLTDVLDSLDHEIRARAAHGDRTITATVPPCHPRAIY
jgi:hypothetical protein